MTEDEVYEPTYEEQAWADAAFDESNLQSRTGYAFWISLPPVYRDPDGWWFYDETWAAEGPFESEGAALDALDWYVKNVLR